MNNQNMNSISPRRLGLAFGLTGVVFYLACILTMITAPYDKQIVFFNSLLHGIDVSPILRTSVPFGEVLVETIFTFILAWFAGHGCRLLQFDRREGTKMNDCRERSSMAGNHGTPDVCMRCYCSQSLPSGDE